ncbi:MAG: hypothetical protein DRJ67_04115 [Thermoprotei archaeon]|nr:MAG: hypothetical protein DRJ67_04115 [Thermoprotei archaeon]
MGREWIHLDELELPEKCPRCGSRRFIVYGAKKVEYKEVYEVVGGEVRLVDSEQTDIEWEVAYGVECAECGEDLSELAGF